jgi:hypothetical protein
LASTLLEPWNVDRCRSSMVSPSRRATAFAL